MLFKNIRAVTEAGVLVVGSNGSTITDLTIENFSLSIQKLSDGPGGFHDLRPPLDTGNRTGVQDDAIYLEHANHVNISGVKAGTLITCPVGSGVMIAHHNSSTFRSCGVPGIPRAKSIMSSRHFSRHLLQAVPMCKDLHALKS